MNAIVTGKVEKPEGSLVFKTLESFVIPESSAQWYVYNGKPEYYDKLVKIITDNDSVTIFAISSVSDLSSSRRTALNLGSNHAYTSFYTQGSDTPYAFIISPATTASSYIKSLEIGTLE